MSSHSSPQDAKDWARLASNREATPYELAHQLAWNRREFIRSAAAVALGSSLLPSSLLARTGDPISKRKVIMVTFGDGPRDKETFAIEGQENIPPLKRELITQ